MTQIIVICLLFSSFSISLAKILPANKLSVAPRHPYPKALADSVFITDPTARKETVPIEGEVPSPFNLPAGCVFGTCCPYVRSVCRDTPPTLTQIDKDETVASHFPLNN